MRVLVTGSSGCFARVLLPRLCADAAITGVTGIDLRPPHYRHEKFRAVQMDIRSPAISTEVAGNDALVHLAFIVLRGRMSEAQMFDINVRGAQKFFHTARGTGVQRFVHMSSAAIYGRGIHLDEETPAAPLPEFLYAQHHAHFEHLLRIEFPECVCLRPHMILGPHAQPLLKRLLRLPFYMRMPEPGPLLQCVHENDVAAAVMLALKKPARGAYNLAIDDTFALRDVIRERHRAAIALPRVVVSTGYSLAWRLAKWGGEPGWMESLSHSLLLNCRRAITELGWRSSYRAADVMADL
jgi:UDP-glucose 4-epimerase